MAKTNTKPELRFAGFTQDWEEKQFENVFTNISNNSLSRDKLNYVSGIAKNVHYGDILVKFNDVLDVKKEVLPYISDNDTVEKLKNSFLKDGDIIISDAAEDETVGKCVELYNVNEEKILSGLHTIAIRPKEIFAPKYLGYYLNSGFYHNQLLKLMQGTKVLSVSKSSIKKTVIRNPKSKEEQKLIGNFFENIDNLITEHQQKHNKLKALKQGMLDKMFPKQGQLIPEIRFKGFEGDWKEYEVGKIFKVTRGNVLAASKLSKTKSDVMQYPVYSSQTTNNGLLGYYDDYLFEDAITWTTDGANAGTVNFRKGKFYSTNVNGVLLSDEGFANTMVAEAINKLSDKYVSRVGNPKLMNNVMSQIKIVIPNSIDEQNLISRELELMDNVKSQHEMQITKLQNIKKAFLAKMFI